MEDRWQAFNDLYTTVDPLKSGILDQNIFTVKDVLSIKGIVNTAGNPDWEKTHLPAERTAKSIETLLENGAKLFGRTHTDELMYSLNGENYHYGTPINPKASTRIPGGSSSGSAVAVSAGVVDFALGTDTGGSVRIPSSYCGVYGLRPTHNSIDMEEIIPLAESFDTLGIMTSSIDKLIDVTKVLTRQQSTNKSPFKHVIFPTEVWEMIDEEIKDSLHSSSQLLINHLSTTDRKITTDGLEKWMDTFRTIQGYEIWRNHGKWITEVNPRFGPGIMERFLWTQTIEKQKFNQAKRVRDKIKENMIQMLSTDTIIALPTSPAIAPLLNTSGEALQNHRKKLLMMTSIAGLSGLPQVSLPLHQHKGAPIGYSLIAGPNQDVKLLEFVKKILIQNSSVNQELVGG